VSKSKGFCEYKIFELPFSLKKWERSMLLPHRFWDLFSGFSASLYFNSNCAIAFSRDSKTFVESKYSFSDDSSVLNWTSFLL
jgi:hypothetical protein